MEILAGGVVVLDFVVIVVATVVVAVVVDVAFIDVVVVVSAFDNHHRHLLEILMFLLPSLMPLYCIQAYTPKLLFAMVDFDDGIKSFVVLSYLRPILRNCSLRW